jgi:hypothetical protein
MATVNCSCGQELTGGVSEAPDDTGRAPDDSGAPPVADAGRVVMAPRAAIMIVLRSS